MSTIHPGLLSSMNPPAPQNPANSTSTLASTSTGNIPVPKRTRLIEVILAPFRKYRLVKSRTGNGGVTIQSGLSQRGVATPPSAFKIIQGISYINRKIITPASVTLAAINGLTPSPSLGDFWFGKIGNINHKTFQTPWI